MNSNNSTNLDTPLVCKALAQAVSGGNNATLNKYIALAIAENERERGPGVTSAKDTQPPTAAKTFSADEMVRMVGILGGGNTESVTKLYAIAKDESLSAEERMIKLLEMDLQFIAHTSPRWSELLGVSEGAIRKMKTWKEMQKRKKNPD